MMSVWENLDSKAMFSPVELEGEVDHTFFDSDCEDGSRGGGTKPDSELIMKNYSLPTVSAKIQSNSANDRKSLTEVVGEPTNLPVYVDNKISKELSRGDKLSPIITSDSGNEEDAFPKKPSKHFKYLLSESNVSHEDFFEESDKNSSFKKENARTKKKSNSLYSSPVSSVVNKETDSESCDSDDSSYSKHIKTSSSEDRGSRVGSSAPEESRCDSTDGSDDTVTDVSPMSSRASSRLQSLNLNHSETEDDDLNEQQLSAPSSGYSTPQREESVILEETDEYNSSSLRRMDGKGILRFPGSRHRKNYSFSNDEVQRIDRENQRLLRRLSGSRPGSVSGQRHRITSNAPKYVPSSAVTRQREQQRIERENLAFLRKLQSVKPTNGMKRSEQLADYQRHIGYLGICPVHQSTGSTSTSKGVKQNKATYQSARAAAPFSSTPVPKLGKTKAAQPTWS